MPVTNSAEHPRQLSSLGLDTELACCLSLDPGTLRCQVWADLSPQPPELVVRDTREQVVEEVIVVPANQERASRKGENTGVSVPTDFSVGMVREPAEDE